MDKGEEEEEVDMDTNMNTNMDMVDVEEAEKAEIEPLQEREEGAGGGEDNEASTDWMFWAASCSAMLGLFVLCSVCVWAYKSFGRTEYERIPSVMGRYPAKKEKLKSFKRISLRNIGISDVRGCEEERNIMHPAASYTFDE